jgi:CheY-like chemotaxis protein
MTLRVLVIDDEPLTLEMLSVVLDMAGYEVMTASSIPDAWEILTYDSLPDAICCDLMLPGITGLDFLEQRLEKPEIAAIPVIVITGSGKRDWLEKAEKLGAYTCLGKPFEMKDLTSVLTQATFNNVMMPV